MRSRIVPVWLTCFVLALFSFNAGQADASSQTGTYVAGAVNGNGYSGNVADGYGIGGYEFKIATGEPRSVTITDSGAGAIGFSACQFIRNAETTTCGSTDTIVYRACAISGRSASLENHGFRADLPLTIFTDTYSLFCDGNATVGTITVNFS